MGSREDDEYWNDKYAEEKYSKACDKHEDDLYFDEESDEWACFRCVELDELTRTYKHG